MMGSIAALLLSATIVAATPCEKMADLKFDDARIVSAVVVPEGPPPARGGFPGAGARGAGPGRGAQGVGPGRGVRGAFPGGRMPAQNIPAHCKVQMVLTPTSDSLINMELWLPAKKWNGKFMGVGNGGFAGSIQGLTFEMPEALRLGYATAGTDTGHQEQGRATGQSVILKK